MSPKQMDVAGRFRKLAVKRGLTPGALLDASPDDFDLLLLAASCEFTATRTYTEREVNDLLGHWLQTAGGMLAVDHVELRRWLVDFAVLARDAYGRAYSRAITPARLLKWVAEAVDVDFRHEFADANAQESQKREARKRTWQHAKAGS